LTASTNKFKIWESKKSKYRVSSLFNTFYKEVKCFKTYVWSRAIYPRVLMFLCLNLMELQWWSVVYLKNKNQQGFLIIFLVRLVMELAIYFRLKKSNLQLCSKILQHYLNNNQCLLLQCNIIIIKVFRLCLIIFGAKWISKIIRWT
jgi:hypothetical protein